MNAYIDIYCERTEPGLWAEPLNAVTNLSFVAAGLFALFLARRADSLNWRSGLLIALIFTIGTGSALFHTFATAWAQLADVLPILFYQIVFIVLYAETVMGWKRRYGLALLGLFFATVYGFSQLPGHWLNGSIEYGPAWLFLLGLALWHMRYAERERPGLLLAVGVFTLSLAFRSIDMAACESLPLGTHFLWHGLNGLVLYLTTRAWILNKRSP